MIVQRLAADRLATSCWQALPHEAAGFLLGSRRGRTVVVSDVYPLAGAASGPDSFEVSDQAVRRAEAWAEDRRLEILALFHCHPSGDAGLSAADRRSLGHSPWPWVIVTLGRDGQAMALSAFQAGTASPMVIAVEH